MSKPVYIEVEPMGRWGRYPTFPGKVGTHASCCLIIKRTRKFYVGQRIEFAMEHELRGVSKSFGIHKWHNGYIWKIEDRIFVNYV